MRFVRTAMILSVLIFLFVENASARTTFNIVDNATLTVGYVHGLLFHDNYIWASTRTSPTRLFKINPSNLTDFTNASYTGTLWGESLINASDYIWISARNTSGQTMVIIRVNQSNISDYSTIGNKSIKAALSIESCNGFLWAGMRSPDPVNLIKMNITDLTYESIVIPEIYDYNITSLICDKYQNETILFASMYNGTNNARLMSINTSNATNYTLSSQIFSDYLSDDMAINSQYVYSCQETTEVIGLRFNKTTLIATNITLGNSPCYGSFYDSNYDDVRFLLAATEGAIEITDNDLTFKEIINISSIKAPNEIVKNSSNPNTWYITSWESPAKIYRLDNITNGVCIKETGICWHSIQDAINNATDYQTVIITNSSVYNENVNINQGNITVTSNSSAFPSIRSTYLDTVRITKGNVTFSNFIIIYETNDYSNNALDISAENVTVDRLYIYHNLSKQASLSGVIRLSSTSNITISNTSILDTASMGIYVLETQNVTLKNVSFQNINRTAIFMDCGIADCSATHDIDSSNTINGKPIFYNKSLTTGVFENLTNIGQLIIANSSNIKINNVTLYESGLTITASNNTNITNSSMNVTSWGVFLYYSKNITLKNNNITTALAPIKLGYTIYDEHCTGNLYENNYINSSMQMSFPVYIRFTNDTTVVNNKMIGNHSDIQGTLTIENGWNNNISSNEVTNEGWGSAMIFDKGAGMPSGWECCMEGNIISNNIFSVKTNGSGIFNSHPLYLDTHLHITLSNNTYYQNGTNLCGLAMSVQNATVYNETIISNAHGLCIAGNDNVTIINMNVSANQSGLYHDINVTRLRGTISGIGKVNGGDAYLINSTFNKSSIYINDNQTNARIYVQWWLNTSVYDTTSNLLNQTNIIAYDVNNTVAFSTTAINGIAYRNLTEFLANITFNSSSGYLYFSNYTINASKNGYTSNSTVVNLTSSQSIELILSEDVPPNITFISQEPSDITTLDIFWHDLNITYDITDVSGINISTVFLYYKANETHSGIFIYINGTAVSDYQIAELFSNSSDTWNFTLRDNEVYPCTYNFNETELRNIAHENYDLDSNNEYIKIRLFNVSRYHNYSIFEVMALNQTGQSKALRMYYCNASYTTGNPVASDYCTNFYNLAGKPYNHTHSIHSSHQLIPFSMNTTTGYIGSVYVTNTSYFLLRGVSGVNAWNVSYITNISRADTIQTSTNAGTSWSDFAGTINAHLHQYNGSDTFYYYVCANDTSSNQNCSAVRQDLIDLAGLPPTAPDVYSPSEGYYSRSITINYTESLSPNDYPIVNYNISLVNTDETFNMTIISQNYLNLSYVWNSLLASDGEYYMRVEACDNQNQCSFGYSENFTIDNTAPRWYFQGENSSTPLQHVNVSLYAYWTNANLSYAMLETNETGSWVNKSTVYMVGNITSWSNFTFYTGGLGYGYMFGWRIYANDSMGNENVTATRTIVITDAVKPVINSYDMYPDNARSIPDIIMPNEKFTVEANVTDNANVSYVEWNAALRAVTCDWAGTYYNYTMPLVSGSLYRDFERASPLAAGRWCINVTANDTSGNSNSTYIGDLLVVDSHGISVYVYYETITGEVGLEGIEVYLLQAGNTYEKETNWNGDVFFKATDFNLTEGNYSVELRDVPEQFYLPERQMANWLQGNHTLIEFELKMKPGAPVFIPVGIWRSILDWLEWARNTLAEKGVAGLFAEGFSIIYSWVVGNMFVYLTIIVSAMIAVTVWFFWRSMRSAEKVEKGKK